MSASLSETLVECAPGNLVMLVGANLAGTLVTLGGQLNIHSDGSAPTMDGSVPIAANYTSATAVSFVVPDGVTSGVLEVSGSSGPPATVPLRVVGQYVQASEYIGEGVDTTDLQPGELDQILRDATAYADAYIGGDDREARGLRYLQTVEHHKFHPRMNRAPKFWPFRRPIVSVDSFVFETSNQLRTQFNVSTTSSSDVYVNATIGYVEILAYAFGNYVLLGAIETIGFSANVCELGYTAGYKYVDYPAALRKATKIIATELLTYRKIQFKGMGGFAGVRKGLQQYDRRSEVYDIPLPAKALLRPFLSHRMA